MKALVYVAAGALLLGPCPAAAADLAPGDRAPELMLAGSDGKTHRISDHAGKQVVVLAWFPRAFTAG